VTTDHDDAESRIIRPNGAEIVEIIEINVHRNEFASDDDDTGMKSDRLVDANRLVMTSYMPRVK